MEADVETSLKELSDDSRWLASHYAGLRKSHPGHYVAIKGGHIVGVDRDLKRLLKALSEKGIDPAESLVEYLPERDYAMVL
ncbi:MAG: hypothetical protein HY558_05390 [Euryarchaeota archaeon]|nr:hypothetical protein [Euryarchaeota archaeon]